MIEQPPALAPRAIGAGPDAAYFKEGDMKTQRLLTLCLLGALGMGSLVYADDPAPSKKAPETAPVVTSAVASAPVAAPAA